jgi:hypothetical protein
VSSREDWQRRLGPLYGGAVALVHSTPWRWPDALTRNEARSPFWVLAVGAPIGVVAWLAATLLRSIDLPAPLAALLGLAVLTFASAAIVERGVVERIDGTATAPSVLAMLVLVFGTLLRAVAIIWLPPTKWLGVFLATALVGRWAAVFLQSLGDPIIDDDAPRSLVVTPAPAWLIGALSGGGAVGIGFKLGKVGILALVLAAAAAFAIGLDAQRRHNGLTSPVVATAAAIAEVVLLLAATI